MTVKALTPGGPLTCPRTQPPWEFLLSASRTSLQSYELSRLSHAANLRKEIAALLDQWVDESSAAMLARYLMDLGERASRAQEVAPAAESLAKNGPAVSDNLFPNRAASPPANRAPLEEVAIFGCLNASLPLKLPLTTLLSFCLRSVFGAVFVGGFRSLATALPSSASRACASPLLPTSTVFPRLHAHLARLTSLQRYTYYRTLLPERRGEYAATAQSDCGCIWGKLQD